MNPTAFCQKSRLVEVCKSVGNVSVAHFGPANTNQSSLKCHSLFDYCLWPQFTYLLMATSSTIMHHHKATFVSNWFHEHDNELSVLQWPYQSLDPYPIEHLWDVIEREMWSMKLHLKYLHELHNIIMWTWIRISKEGFHLEKSMPQRIEATLGAKGGPIQY